MPLLPLLLLAAFVQDEIPALATQVRDVTVYGSEALVTRAGKAKVARGVTHLEVRGLPNGLRDESVKVKTGAEATVVGVDVLHASGTTAPSRAVEELRAARKAKQRERDENGDRLEVAKQLRAYLDSIRAEAPKVAGQATLSGALDPGKWEGGYGVLAKAYADNAEGARRLLEKLAVLDAELADLDRQLERLQAGATVPTKTVALDLLADAPADADVEVSYLVGDAGWSPTYDLRTSASVADAAVAVYGVVVQRTGEDWKDVALTLSTAKPERGAAPPPLRPMVVAVVMPEGRRGENVRKAERAEEKGRDDEDEKRFGFADKAAPATAAPPLPRDVQVSSSGLATQMRVPRPET